MSAQVDINMLLNILWGMFFGYIIATFQIAKLLVRKAIVGLMKYQIRINLILMHYQEEPLLCLALDNAYSMI